MKKTINLNSENKPIKSEIKSLFGNIKEYN